MGKREYIDSIKAKNIIHLFMSCYKAGLKDAEWVNNSLLCEDFKQSVRVPGVYGLVTQNKTYDYKIWRTNLIAINGGVNTPGYLIDLLMLTKANKSLISCIFPLSQEFYILGLDDFNSNPTIHNFAFFDNKKQLKWTKRGIKSLTYKQILSEVQRMCMKRIEIDEEFNNKYSIKRMNYDRFTRAFYSALIYKFKL